uniref:Uncharacterized protein n=1 Tax=Arundo donax TaxID=35708 RepID=A0A0A9EF00_ARUDO
MLPLCLVTSSSSLISLTNSLSLFLCVCVCVSAEPPLSGTEVWESG